MEISGPWVACLNFHDKDIVDSMENEFPSLCIADCVVRGASCLSADVGSETVLMSIESGCYGGVDDIGSDIWKRLESPVVIADLCRGLAAEYDADLMTVEKDVLVFLDALRQQKMIDVVIQ